MFIKALINGKWCLVEIDENTIPIKRTFDYIGDFHSGNAVVKLNDKWNLIDTEGNLVSPNKWFDNVFDLTNGYACVKINDKWNFIDTKGNILYGDPDDISTWFDSVEDFNKNGCALVQLNSKFNIIDNKGIILYPYKWFDEIFFTKNGYELVDYDDIPNSIDDEPFPEEFSDYNYYD